jgi:hypothetical protein
MSGKVLTYAVVAVVIGTSAFVAIRALIPAIMNVFANASRVLAHTP